MNRKQGVLLAAALLLSAVTGAGLSWWLGSQNQTQESRTSTSEPGKRKILYYRNPMGTGHTSPVPMKDDMGMDYIPVYADEEKKPADRKILYYKNPMGTGHTSPVPMKDNMGMDYIPVYADEAKGGASAAEEGIKVDPRMVQNLGVRVAPVQRSDFSQDIRTVGTVKIDERRIETLNPRTSGWVEELRVKAVGDPVRKGQVLARIYSPELLSAQEEYLIARRGLRQLGQAGDAQLMATSRALLDASRERLRLLGMTPAQISELARRGETQRRTPLLAPANGIITELGAREGGYITPDTRVMGIADLSTVWVDVDLYANQLPFVDEGDPVRLTVESLPQRQWQGRIDYLYPTLDTESRTVRARVVVPNPNGALRPGMYATAQIQAGKRENVLVVPREAVIRSGEHSRVIVALGGGHFLPTEVRLGAESGDQVQILEGLKAGQQVVVSGQFLLDSESSFQGALNRLEGGNTAPTASAAPSTATQAAPAPMQHGGH